jgi:hypothetical protein
LAAQDRAPDGLNSRVRDDKKMRGWRGKDEQSGC